jgi:protein-disulfide isomerase
MESSSMTDPIGIGGVIPPLSDRDHVQGSINAPIILMNYGDYQCPQSGQAHIAIKTMQQRLGDQFCLIFRHFPQPNVHPQSRRTAESAEAANAQGKFWQMHDLLFEHQQNLSDADLVKYANQIGLDIPQFLRELAEHLHAERVQEDIESGHVSGITETPTCYIGIRNQDFGNLDALLMTIMESNVISYTHQ